ncbi:MAG: beta-1,6-N-acetylglucosaminyltransferase [Pseudomonadota bacterium]
MTAHSTAFILLVHENLAAAGALAAALATGGRPVAVHIDRRVSDAEVMAFAEAAERADLIHLPRRVCNWGMFSLVEATLDGIASLLRSSHEFTHVTLVSGADLPMRPLAELDAFLADHRHTDLIEANELSERRWVMDGLSEERFHLYHPFNWRTQRSLFDGWVTVQRFFRVHRRVPPGLRPALGSQWWSLSRGTLAAIMADPQLPLLKRFFRWCWIPDESFFQTLARRHGQRRINQSPTLARFDPRGMPYVFHDDHGALLAQSDHFFARKVHPRAGLLRRACLARALDPAQITTFAARAPDDEFARARHSRTHGREHLISPARFPLIKGKAQRASAFPYTVIGGVGTATATMISQELTRRGDITVHGRVFAAAEVAFNNKAPIAAGMVPASVAARNFWPDQFAINLARGGAGSAVAFCLSAEDRFAIGDYIAKDPGARIIWYRGAWALDLYEKLDLQDGPSLAEQAREMASAERNLLATFRRAGAALTIHSAADLVDDPEGAAADMLAIANARAGRREMKPPSFAPPHWHKARPFLRGLQKAGCEVEAGLLAQPAADERSEQEAQK